MTAVTFLGAALGHAVSFHSDNGQKSSMAGTTMSKMVKVVLGIGTMVAVWSLSAAAQLSDADLVRLKEEGQAKGWTFEIGRTEASRRPAEELSGLHLPAPEDPFWKTATRRPVPAAKADLPASWDWCALGGVTAVKDQRNCGSCWAFSTAGVVESAIKIRDGIEVDLSEQHLLSCNTAGWGCSGAIWAYAWLINKPDACGYVGAALEADYPYTGMRSECACAAPRTWRVQDYSYVNGLQPTVPEIKQALMDHGPLGCSLYTSSAFGAYHSGVFNANENPSVFDIDHALMIVGWDDTKGAQGAWIIKNSWGTDWGENGFGYIEYGCNLIGYAANYVIYEGSRAGIQVVPLSGFSATGPLGGPFTPSGTAYTVTNAGTAPLQWQAVPPAWLDASPSQGTLEPGASATVTVTVNTSAAVGGVLGADLVFRNYLTGEEQRRWMSLDSPKTPVYMFNLDTDPGWSTTGEWAYGVPQGYSAAHGADPASAFTGTAVYGYNLAGYYANSLTKQYLTTTVLDFSNWQDVELRFQRWLGVESSRWDHASIEASADGVKWVQVWNHEGGDLAESGWGEQVCSLSKVADRQATVQVRWVMGATDSVDTYAGWNLDDIEFRANPKTADPEGEGEPETCDVDSLTNIFRMLLMIGDSNADQALTQAEASVYLAEVADFWYLFDLDADGVVSMQEFVTNPLVQGFLPPVDADSDNQITYSELTVLTDIITQDMFILVDKDSSGAIDCGDLGYAVKLPCPECAASSQSTFDQGEDACLAVPGGAVDGETYQWSKAGVGQLVDGRYEGTRCANLMIRNLSPGDSGTYTCEYGPEKAVYSKTITVVQNLPLAGMPALAALAIAAAAGGARMLLRRRRS